MMCRAVVSREPSVFTGYRTDREVVGRGADKPTIVHT
jgi:hypothetical protein